MGAVIAHCLSPSSSSIPTPPLLFSLPPRLNVLTSLLLAQGTRRAVR